MTRIRIWYDDACDQIFISGEMHSFAPRSLICVLNGNGSTILVHMAGTIDAYVAGGNFADFGDAAGSPFPNPQATKDYLDEVFSRSRTWPPTITSGEGNPLNGLGSAGDLYIDAESGDLYRKE